jgi:methylase of polypeptide subunit release factors
MRPVSARSHELPEGTPTADVVARIAAAFAAASIPAVLLRAPRVDAGAAANVPAGSWRHDLDVLVPRSHRREAAAVLDELDWTLVVGGFGGWSRVATVSYHWEYAPALDVHRGLPAGPAPSRSLRALERALFDRSLPTASGLAVPDDSVLAVFSAVQAARPSSFRRMWLADFVAHLTGNESEVRTVARSVGVSRCIDWALGSSAADLPAHRGGAVFDAPMRRWMWRGMLRVRRHLRPRRVGAVLGGLPRIGATPVRARFAGLELHAGPGAFVPQPVTEPMVALAVEGVGAGPGHVVCDVGTGVGGVALAVARARPDAKVLGCDVSRAGLRWARRNGRRLGIRNVEFRRGSLLDPLGERLADRVDVITGNVPYVPPHVFGPTYRDHDKAVLGAGDDGLDLHRELLRESIMFLAPQGRLILQLAIDQWEVFAAEMRAWGYATQPMAATSFEDAICWGIADQE